MLLHGDELGRTQQGNNNTYAQDSEIALGALGRRRPAARRVHRRASPACAATTRRSAASAFFTGTTVRTGDGERLNDIVWLHPDGHPMEDGDWTADDARSIGMYLNGDGIPGVDAPRRADHRRPLPPLLQRPADDVPLTLPPEEYAAAWDVVIDTAGREPDGPLAAGAATTLAGRSVLVLRAHAPVEEEPDSSVAASVAASRASRADKAG